MRKPRYDTLPSVAIPGDFRECSVGWDKIAAELQRAIAQSLAEKPILAVECYPGVDDLTVLNELASRLAPALTIRAADAYHPSERIDQLVAPFLPTKDPIKRFDTSHATRLSLVNFFNAEPLWRFRRTIDELKGGLVLIVGCGASLVAWGNILVHADLARREARERFYQNNTGNLGADNKSVPATLKINRASHIDWPLSDRWKRPLIKRWDYVLDTNDSSEPKLADADDVRRGLQAATTRPFRVVPACDPSGETKNPDGQLDCILEETSLLLSCAGLRIEVPAIDLLFYQPQALLGEAVQRRFGHEFPSRFGSLAPLAGPAEPLTHGDGWREERVSLNEQTSIEMRRHWFSKTMGHDTGGGINVLKLIEGDEAIVESPDRAFEPFVVHFAETFIVPAAVGSYNIRPRGSSAGTEIATLKASVRIRSSNDRML